MKITDRHIEMLKQDGFVVIENFLSKDVCDAALEGFFKHFPRSGGTPGWKSFPTEDSALNAVFMHPDVIDCAERIHQDRDLLHADGMFGVRYAGEPAEQVGGVGWHLDYRNNTLGPEIVDRAQMYKFPAFAFYLNDIRPGDAPIRMMRHGQTYDDAVDITGPAGTLWMYTLFTWHTATHFKNPAGFRSVVSYQLTPRKRMFDVARLITQKSGANPKALERLIVDATPRQLQLLGFPPPRDPFWTPEYVAGMEKRYPGFKGDLYRAAEPALR